MGRNKEDKYEDCIPTAIPIPKDLHKDLKLWCVENNKPMKEVLHEINIKAIKEYIGGK